MFEPRMATPGGQPDGQHAAGPVDPSAPGPRVDADPPPPWWGKAPTSEMPTAARRLAGDPLQGTVRHLYAVPAPDTGPPPAPDRPAVDVTASFRGSVASRLRRFSFLHARHAWEQRRRDPLAPHGVAFFYLEPRARQLEQLRTATRIFLADEEAASLPHLLYGLAQHARDGYSTGPGFDPRVAMANRVEDMSPFAVFAGVGVVTLDTPHGSWKEAQHRAHGEQDLPGRCYARLIDGSMLLMDRGGEEQFNVITVECSIQDGNTHYDTPSLRWRWNPALAETPETDPTFHVWRWMGEIGRIIDHGSRSR
ncbi:hypothetical protein ABT297_41160 [Dactylosporangium sp. NPDC000555]|uniref:hypothetical protein n=1 Tax=Dactylosporangium sp. NPDC000555 TaxID=3154260 RepID=UPI003316530A